MPRTLRTILQGSWTTGARLWRILTWPVRLPQRLLSVIFICENCSTFYWVDRRSRTCPKCGRRRIHLP